MFNRYKYMDEAGEGGEAGGGGAAPSEEKGTVTVDIDALIAENNRLKAKVDHANRHMREAEKAKQEAERMAAMEAEEKARKEGDFEQLHRSSEQKRQELAQQLEELRTKIHTEKRDNAALKLAGELAEGSNAELLSEFVKRRLKASDDGIQVLDVNGNLTVATLADLTKEIAADSRYAALLRGNKATGGGATGGKSSGGAAKEMTRSDWDALPHNERMKFVRSGGKVI